MTISAIIIAKDAQDLIVDCLESLSFSQEIIVIDSGSSDNTIALAKKHNAKVFVEKSSDFSKLREVGLKKASGDWVFYIDTDERADTTLAQTLPQIILLDAPFAAYRIRRKNFYFGQYEWPYTEHLERFFRRDKLRGWHGQLHETASVDGTIGEVDGYLLHYTHRNLTQMLEKTIVWADVEAKLRLAVHHPKMTWWRFPRVMITAFWNSYITQGGWKIGTPGLIESIYQAFSMFITYARLWEYQNKLITSDEKK